MMEPDESTRRAGHGSGYRDDAGPPDGATFRESETRYRSLFENSMDAILLVLLDGTISAANPAACALFGMTEEEMRRAPRFGLIDPQDTRIEDYLRQRNETGKSRSELILFRKDGTKFVGDVSASVLPGDPPRAFVMIRDVSDRKRAEEALRLSEERYRELVQKTNSAIVRWTPDGTITFFNEYAQRFFGYSAEEVVGKPAHIFVPETDSNGQDMSWLIDDILKHPDQYSSHVNENIRRDGRRAWIAWANMPVFDDNGRFVEIFSVGTDITHQKHIEDELKELNATLEKRVWERTRKLNDTIRQLRSLADQLTRAEDQERQRLAELLHNDIQQLLVASRMRLGLVPAGSADAETKEHIETAEELLDAAIAKTRDLSHELRPPLLRKRGMLEALGWLCAQIKAKYGLNVRLVADEDVDLDEPIKIFLFRAAQEILFNAVKHAGVGEAEMHFNRIDRIARLMIADNGRGFDPAVISPEHGGKTGFGLFSIQERIALLGGWIDIESAPGNGSRFTIHIPLETAPNENEG